MATLTTPKFAFPYPDGNERVADGDNAMGALAQAVEDAMGFQAPVLRQQGATLVLTNVAQYNDQSFTWTPTRDQLLLIIAVWDFNVTTAGTGTIIGNIDLDGATLTGTASWTPPAADATSRNLVTQAYVVQVTANVSHTIKQRAQKANAGGVANLQGSHSRFIVLRM